MKRKEGRCRCLAWGCFDGVCWLAGLRRVVHLKWREPRGWRNSLPPCCRLPGAPLDLLVRCIRAVPARLGLFSPLPLLQGAPADRLHCLKCRRACCRLWSLLPLALAAFPLSTIRCILPFTHFPFSGSYLQEPVGSGPTGGPPRHNYRWTPSVRRVQDIPSHNPLSWQYSTHAFDRGIRKAETSSQVS